MATCKAKLSPTFPAIPTFKPAFLSICHTNNVVVVLPLLPVMPIIFASVYRAANSISEMIGTEAFFKSCIKGIVSGIPGLLTIISASKKRFSECFSSSHSIALCVRTFLYFSFIFPISERNTSNPFCCANSAAPQPLSPPPSTTTFPIISVLE